MNKSAPVIIIGTGCAGYTAAKELRKLAPELAISLYTGDDGSVYSKPNLSCANARNKKPEQLVTASAAQMSMRLKSEIFTHSIVESIDPKEKLIKVNGREISYSKLILACGAYPRPNEYAMDRVMHVNNLDEYRKIRELLDAKDDLRLIIMGAGLVGCEFASDWYNSHQISVIAPSEYPLDNLVPKEIGDALQRSMPKVAWHLSDTASSIEMKGESLKISLNSGKILESDLVLSAIGLIPDTRLALGAGLKIDRGILVNEYLQSSDPNIYALGDCAQYQNIGLKQYIKAIMFAAPMLAKHICGQAEAINFPVMPIGLKTPTCPISVVPGDLNQQWQVEGEGIDLRAMLYDKTGNLNAFALSGACATEAAVWSEKIII